MERVLSGGLKIETIEKCLIIPDVVEGPELGSVQKTAAAHAIDGQKVADSCGAIAQAETSSSGAERTIVRVDVSEHPPRAEAGARRDVCHQAGLVAEFGLWRPGDDFHALDGAGGKLRGEHLALLVADGLPVNHKADLRVIAERVEQPVTVGGDTSCAVYDCLAQASSRIDVGEFHDERTVGVNVRRGFHFQHVRARRLYVNGLLRSGNVQSGLHLDRHGTSYIEVLLKSIESSGRHFQVVWIRWDVGDPERSVGSRDSGLRVAGYGIADRDRGVGQSASGRVQDRSQDRSCITERLAEAQGGEAERQQTQNRDSKYSLHTVQYREECRACLN